MCLVGVVVLLYMLFFAIASLLFDHLKNYIYPRRFPYCIRVCVHNLHPSLDFSRSAEDYIIMPSEKQAEGRCNSTGGRRNHAVTSERSFFREKSS